jgi:hypothetical protein
VVREKGGGGGKGGEITQTLYAHMNKRNNFLKMPHKRTNTGVLISVTTDLLD